MINSAGGAEKMFCEKVNMLSERSHCVTVLAFDNNKGITFYTVNENVQFINSGQGCKLKKLWQKIMVYYTMNRKNSFLQKKNCVHIMLSLVSIINK